MSSRAIFLMGLAAAVCALVPCGLGFAADAVSLDFKGRDRSCEIEASFDVQAERSMVWSVLTDYEQLPRFVGNLKKSRVQKKLGPGHILLEQEFEGGFLFITQKVRVLLDIRETWCQSILFKDVDHKDFEFYRGSWELSPGTDKGLKVTYSLKARRHFDGPFAGDYMRGGIKNLLDSVRREILSRQAQKEKGPAGL